MYQPSSKECYIIEIKTQITASCITSLPWQIGVHKKSILKRTTSVSFKRKQYPNCFPLCRLSDFCQCQHLIREFVNSFADVFLFIMFNGSNKITASQHVMQTNDLNSVLGWQIVSWQGTTPPEKTLGLHMYCGSVCRHRTHIK